jgi:succinyl-CoA:acetate CoA-transferase
MYEERIKCAALIDRVMSAQKAASFIESGMTVGMSGFSTGAPKVIPVEMLNSGNLSRLTILQGAGLGFGDSMLDVLARSGAVSRYAAFQWDAEMRKNINSGNVAFTDIHLSQFADKIRKGDFGKIDFAIIECSKIYEDGGIVPTLSAGISNVLIEEADRVLLELNLAVPAEIDGIFDILKNNFMPILGVLERIGSPAIHCDPDKIAGIVITKHSEHKISFRDTNELYQSMARNILELLKSEIAAGRLQSDFTLQAGVGGVVNAVIRGLGEGGFKNLKMYTEVLADGALGFITDGVISEAATTALDLSPDGIETFFGNLEFYKKHVVIRPLEISNGITQISSLGLVSINSAVEADIYGNINSTNTMGTDIMNGIGGSNDFCRSAKLSIFITPSTAKDGSISSVVPMVSHVDNTEHDVDIIVTEYGYADLRGKSPKERVTEIIENCAHPDYRQALREYFNDAVSICGNCQTPHDLSKALSWHQRYLKTGSMK